MMLPQKLCDTPEGRQKIVDWMSWGVDHINKDADLYPGWGLSLFLARQPISTIRALHPATQQIERGEWPDDDAALLEWWNTEGKSIYRETPYAPKWVRAGPNSYPSNLPDTPPTFSFQKYAPDELTCKEKIDRLLS